MAKKTLEQLQEEHSEMLATVADLKMQNIPEDLTIDFDSAELGSTIVSTLDALIRKHREGLDEADELAAAENDDDGNKVVVEEEKKEQVAPARKKTKANNKATENSVASTEEKKSVAKKAVAKKKAPAKKAAAKTNGAAAPKVAKPKNGFDDNAKITWGAKPNPAREGSGRFDRIEAVKKSTGKTVKTFLAAKGNATTLKNCVAAKLCTVA